jgi:hypothetical protein
MEEFNSFTNDISLPESDIEANIARCPNHLGWKCFQMVWIPNQKVRRWIHS